MKTLTIFVAGLLCLLTTELTAQENKETKEKKETFDVQVRNASCNHFLTLLVYANRSL